MRSRPTFADIFHDWGVRLRDVMSHRRTGWANERPASGGSWAAYDVMSLSELKG
jgi:hypothetical protein